MSISICLRNSQGDDLLIGFNLEDEIIHYLFQLKKYASFRHLIELDPYADTHMAHDWVTELHADATAFLLQIRNKRYRIIPPPTRIGTDGSSRTDAGEPFNERELDRLINKMIQVFAQGLLAGNTVWAIGD